jgi:hypothetical protein
LGVNIGRPPYAKDWYGKRVPFPRSYYPGVTDRANAQVLRIEGDQKMENLEFRLPPRSKEVTVSGRVFWRDGSPAKAGVWLVELDYPSDSCQVDSVETNADGSFSLIGATGRRYAVFAHDEASGQHYHSQAIEVQSSEGKSVTVFLIAKESSEDCEICRRFPRRF